MLSSYSWNRHTHTHSQLYRIPRAAKPRGILILRTTVRWWSGWKTVCLLHITTDIIARCFAHQPCQVHWGVPIIVLYGEVSSIVDQNTERGGTAEH